MTITAADNTWVFDSREPGERDRLAEVMDSVFLPFELRNAVHEPRLSVGYLGRSRFGDLSLVTGDASSAFSGATGPISRRRSGDRVAVLLVLAGSQQIRHGHFLSNAQAGDLFVFDGEVLSTIEIPRRSRTLTVVGARSRVLGNRDATHGPLDMSLPGPRLLRDHLRSLETCLPGMSHTDRSIAAEATAQLVRLAISDAAALAAVAHGTTSGALLGPIRSYLEAHLRDYDLDATKVASEFNISVRSLHATFEDAGESFGSFLRRRRMESVRAAILDHPQTPIAVIGAAWCYPNPSALSRAYRRHFGISPHEERRGVCDCRKCQDVARARHIPSRSTSIA
jgi:AraC family transcriptional activator of tynA and feaB